MARASKMGADVATREANRSRGSGHVCANCGETIPQGELLMVRVVDENRVFGSASPITCASS